MDYKPTDSFNANMKMIEDILKDVKKEVGGPEGKVSYILCVVIEPDAKKKTETDFVHTHGVGYLMKIIGILFELLDQGPVSPRIKNMTGKIGRYKPNRQNL